MADCLIWSFEHNGWWAPARSGYVGQAEDGGRYTLAEAEAICRDANIVAFNEAIVPIGRHGRGTQQPTGVRGGLR